MDNNNTLLCCLDNAADNGSDNDEDEKNDGNGPLGVLPPHFVLCAMSGSLKPGGLVLHGVGLIKQCLNVLLVPKHRLDVILHGAFNLLYLKCDGCDLIDVVRVVILVAQLSQHLFGGARQG